MNRIPLEVAYRCAHRSVRDAGPYARLTLERLGKFVALTLRWPSIVADLTDEPRMIDELHGRALDPSYHIKSECATRWASYSDLLALLASGVDRNGDAGGWGLEHVDIERLLRTAPLTARPAQEAREPESGALSEEQPPAEEQASIRKVASSRGSKRSSPPEEAAPPRSRKRSSRPAQTDSAVASAKMEPPAKGAPQRKA